MKLVHICLFLPPQLLAYVSDDLSLWTLGEPVLLIRYLCREIVGMRYGGAVPVITGGAARRVRLEGDTTTVVI
jgi:hypothetical protein